MTPESLKASGWQCISGRGFDDLVGPYWVLDEGEESTTGLFVEERHCNHQGTIHGGVVMTFADIGLGMGVAALLKEDRHNCVTASLQTQFISAARIGEFISCKPEVIRRTRQLVFVRGLITIGEKVIASAEGIWKLFEQPAVQITERC